ncbi:hypothetical protein RW1_022_00350 [Rhodococcus wratislaviensis NBRC 100605]|uniref:Uncharacterized protein n=1 Tax=Rhodococcus wratislaviensis NBRC 100605 TaxID=1219028 RepID=X0PRH6_RHOWR|nr:hypothetical protein RW1_022_00350 [Rhodococcus wratislaviensis NBRC 100605]
MRIIYRNVRMSVSSVVYRGKQRTKRTSAGRALSAAAFRLVASGVVRTARWLGSVTVRRDELGAGGTAASQVRGDAA